MSSRADAGEPPDPLRVALERALGLQYEIGRLIGRGGMGVVYYGRERALEREVAIKVLPPDSAEFSPDARERFRREARTAAQLTHTNIVPLYTFGEIDGISFFVMGYVQGESLASRMAREGRMAEPDATRILSELADALDYAHRKGVVHRDIKPDNVLLDAESGRPMLTDFGIAKGRAGGEGLTRTGMVVGTPSYMSPEQAAGDRNVDGRSDIYALGVLGYEMLAGRAMFAGTSAQEILIQHITQTPAQLAVLVPDASGAVTAAIMRCLEKDPARRLQSGATLRQALARSADDDASVPAGLRRLRGLACDVAVAGYVAALALLAAVRSNSLFSETGFILGGAFVTSVAASFAFVIVKRREGFAWPAVWRVVFMPRSWWILPWPAAWALRIDAARLPANVRRWRRVATWSYALVLLVAAPLTVAALTGADESQREVLTRIAKVAFSPFVVAWGWMMYAASKWALKQGLEESAGGQVLLAPLFSPFWRRPEIDQLLSPETVHSRKPPVANSLQDLLGALAEIGTHHGQALREVSEAAAMAARDAARELESLDRQIASLTTEADPAEVARLEKRLATLAGDSPSRPLVENQLDLLRSLGQRVEALGQRRARLADCIRTLWLQLANLRAIKSLDDPEASEITGRIRGICKGVAHEISAEQETARLLKPGVG